MELYLIRHARAVELGEEGAQAEDRERPLSSRGRKRFQREVRALERLRVRFERVEHSPLLRASQTARLLAPLCDGQRVENPALAAAPTRAFLEGLTVDRTALVGHEPYLSQLASLLLHGKPELAQPLRLGKGAVLWLRGEPTPGGMAVGAYLPAKLLVGFERLT